MRGLLVGGTESGQENGFHVTASHKNNTAKSKTLFRKQTARFTRNAKIFAQKINAKTF